MLVLEGESANEVWVKALSAVETRAKIQHGRRETAYELLHTALCVRNPRDRWTVSRSPALNPAFALADTLWICKGSNDAQFINFWNSRMPEFTGYESTYHGAYGFRLRCHFGIDQLKRAAEALQANPDGRQVVLQIWDVEHDLPNRDGSPRSQDIPCNILSMLKIREGRLEWMQVMRSNDIFLGLPHNLLQFTTLQEILAGWIGVGLGEYHQISDSLHIYQSDRLQVDAREDVAPQHNNDDLMLPMAESLEAIDETFHRGQAMQEPNLSEKQLTDLITNDDIPVSFGNWLRVLGAECARKRGWLETMDLLMSDCNNPILKQVWRGWLDRVISKCGARQKYGRNTPACSKKEVSKSATD